MRARLYGGFVGELIMASAKKKKKDRQFEAFFKRLDELEQLKRRAEVAEAEVARLQRVIIRLFPGAQLNKAAQSAKDFNALYQP